MSIYDVPPGWPEQEPDPMAYGALPPLPDFLQQIGAPEYQPYQPPPGWQGALAGLAGLQMPQGVNTRHPDYNAASFVSGLLGGVGNAAARRINTGEQQRAESNRRNLVATQAYQQAQLKRIGQETPAQAKAMAKARAEGVIEAGPKPTATPTATRVPVPPKLRPYVAPGTKDLTTGELSSLMQTYFPTSNERLVQVMGPSGIPVWVRESEALGKPAAQAARAVTGAERQALSYYNRAKDAIASADELEQQVAGSGTMGQVQLQYAPNMFKTSEQRRYRQAQRAFTEARLRKESGAAIPLHEVENDSRIYFAQPGDDPATIEQKRLKRQTVLDGLAYSSGRAYEEYYGEPMVKRGAAPSSGKVRMTSPSGKVYEFDAAHTDSARAHGYR